MHNYENSTVLEFCKKNRANKQIHEMLRHGYETLATGFPGQLIHALPVRNEMRDGTQISLRHNPRPEVQQGKKFPIVSGLAFCGGLFNL